MRVALSVGGGGAVFVARSGELRRELPIVRVSLACKAPPPPKPPKPPKAPRPVSTAMEAAAVEAIPVFAHDANVAESLQMAAAERAQYEAAAAAFAPLTA